VAEKERVALEMISRRALAGTALAQIVNQRLPTSSGKGRLRSRWVFAGADQDRARTPINIL